VSDDESVLLCSPIEECVKWPTHETTCADCWRKIGYSEGSKRTVPRGTKFLCYDCGAVAVAKEIVKDEAEVVLMPRSPHQQAEIDEWKRRTGHT
jgi:hypothetical protein